MHHPSSSSGAGRARALFVVALVTFVGAVGWLVFGNHLVDLGVLGIPTMQPKFVDARSISGASVGLAQGLDPLVHNPGDPLGRAMNYPRLWLVLADLGLGPEHTVFLALAFVALFFAGIVLFMPLVTTRTTAVLLAIGLFSPAVWLGIERANNDLPMFGLVAAAAWLAARSPRTTGLVLALAAALKLYPIFAVAGLWANGARRPLRVALSIVFAFLAYLWWIRTDLELIHQHTYRWNRIGYGLDQLPNALAEHTGWPVSTLVWVGIAVLLLALAASLVARTRTRLGATAPPHALAAFRMGAAVYLGSFCVVSNFDYRLIFLLLTVPQLVLWASSTRGPVRASVVTLLAIVPLMLWSMTWRSGLRAIDGDGTGLLLDEALSWLLAVGLLVVGVLSVPDSLVPARWHGRVFLDATAAATVVPLPRAADAPPRRADRAGSA